MKPISSSGPALRGPTLRYRLAVFSRALAAVGGGYGVSTLSTMVLARLLPMAPADAVMTATMLSFAIFTCAVIWVFAARSAAQSWLGLALPALLLALVAWLTGIRSVLP
ncbi:DUF3649 domain-containing protein [Herbaspirillum sp. AP02]|uniref:DUF3649 domain-containing protein n=1 Tax=unclassified Herbaspirillum TaxID=2624150 RepID=UPI0015DB6B0A|nr:MULTISPECIES: DUF3649 domain-containing protein [unclassified Herbaspirillum]MBG7622385.1 DUF3649 domain-containing protein [Herbaspirillum sp. AP02]NZD70300.1 DUF3649 domain-containing protein [Herbaspirillum sp. AP21]